MKFTDTSEKGFQKLIVKELTGNDGYVESISNNFDRKFCLNTQQLFSFIEQTQPEKYEMLHRKGERAFLMRLDEKLRKLGVVEVLRKGVKHFGVPFKRGCPLIKPVHEPQPFGIIPALKKIVKKHLVS